jgi:hypothetical protein
LKYVSVSNGKLYGVNSADNIWYGESYKAPNWKLIHGSLKQVNLDKNIVCGANSADVIYCADNDISNPNWFYVPNKSKLVSVSNGALYSVNAENQVSYIKSINDPQWTNLNVQILA